MDLTFHDHWTCLIAVNVQKHIISYSYLDLHTYILYTSRCVQANPVSTTTDSNLLEGQWEFVFSSHRAADIVDPSRFVLIRTESGGGKATSKKQNAAANANKDAVGPVESRPWAIRSGRSENPLRSVTRKIYLEELEDDEDPYVVDTTNYMGGLWSVQRRYDVTGLSRTAMDLGLQKEDLRAFGLRVPLKKKKKEMKAAGGGGGAAKDTYLGNAKVQVIYLDSDLCVTTTERGMDGPLLVYTKGNFWTARRKVSDVCRPLSVCHRCTRVLLICFAPLILSYLEPLPPSNCEVDVVKTISTATAAETGPCVALPA